MEGYVLTRDRMQELRVLPSFVFFQDSRGEAIGRVEFDVHGEEQELALLFSSPRRVFQVGYPDEKKMQGCSAL